MRAIWLSVVVLAVVGCRPSGMRAYTVHSAENGGIAQEAPLEYWNSTENVENSSAASAVAPSPSPRFSQSMSPPDGNAVAVQPPQPGEEKKDSEPSALPAPEANAKDFVKQGNLIPSIYYQPLLLDNDQLCNLNQRETMFGEKGVALIKVCPQTLETCSMEGSCRISQNGVVRSFNVLGGQAGFHTFFEVFKGDCLYGFGVESICLDPFYTVAADLRYHDAGDVIYVPALVGGVLPNGEKHTGFLVVRDRGGGIRGQNRFDFFSGSLTWKDPGNPFAQLNLSDQSTRLFYYTVTGESAKRVLVRRGFPRIPSAR